MNFLRGIIDAVPANGGIKAIRQIKYEYNSYFTKHFFLRLILYSQIFLNFDFLKNL